MRYPNQKQIVVYRENVERSKETGRPYLIAYHDNLLAAMNDLTAAEFKVYLFMLFNTDGYKFDFSPALFEEKTGVCKDTIRKAMATLEKRGYLRYVDNNKYEFSENKKWKNQKAKQYYYDD